MRAPDSLDGTEAEPRGIRLQGAGPVGCLAGRFAKRQGDHALGRLSPKRLDARGARLVAKQTFEPFHHEAFLPAPDAGFGFARSPHDLVRSGAIAGQEHDLSPPDMLLWRIAVLVWSRRKSADDTRSVLPARIARTPKIPQETGIPWGTQMSGSIH